MEDLTDSIIDRQNILNNGEAIENIRKYLGIGGMYFENELRFTRQQVIDFYDIDSSTGYYFIYITKKCANAQIN